MQPAWMVDVANTAADSTPQVAVPVPVVPGRVLHIDGDMIAYWAGGKEDTDVSVSRAVALNKITAMAHHSGAERTVLHLTAESSSKGDRFLISTVKPYQGQRKSGRKPQNWAYLRTWMENYQGPLMRVKLWGTREADDGMAWMAHHSLGTSVTSTKDKDMRMLPGWHMDWDTMAMYYVPPGAFDVVHNGKQYGHKWFWLQMLQGDTADNIPGLPRLGNKLCGEATAEKYLLPCESNAEAYEYVSDGYELHYADDWQDMMLEQALLLWLRTDKGATFEDVYEVLPPSHFDAAMQRVKARVKEKYAEAHKLTGVSPMRKDI